MRDNLPALTSLRFLAAAAIVVHHTGAYFGYGVWLRQHVPLDQGVSFFFVLSGFVLFYSHPELPTFREWGRFWVARIARIWPAHVTLIFLILVFFPWPWGYFAEGLTNPPLLQNVLLLQSWTPRPTHFYSFNELSWSISTESFFYAMFPLLIWRWDRTWWWKIALCAGGALFMIWYATHIGATGLVEGEDKVSYDSLVYIFPVARIFEFSLGVAAGSLYLRLKDRIGGWSTATISIAQAAVLFGGLAAAHYFPGVADLIGMYRPHLMPPAAHKWWYECGNAIIFAGIIFAMAFSTGILARALSPKLFVRLGEISFAMYMTHQIVFRALLRTTTFPKFGDNLTQIIVFWLMVLVFSYGLWALVETRCRRTIVNAFDRLFAPARITAPAPDLRQRAEH
ncbi:acyltransferase family protein [Burkholderia vietnamiensis]|uniref:acyltransferase family protein n=1 Tax=Burkholderia vietnamiensis TaxID=60552 RepID=UPI001D15A15C|nr:acyltransferase [Burkholderia vietnamiensis]UEC03989.1 acyltransferase [Burkholderia vietnamiensis]